MINTIIFDFDGVILESVSIKGETFRDLFAFAPDHTDEIVAFHHNNGGMSRFDKFRSIYKNILNEELTASQFQTLSTRFNTLVLEKILAVPMVTGAEEFLERFYRIIPLFIVSATPQEELGYIVKERGLGHYFSGVFGSPESKENHIARILKTNAFDPACAIYVGDALNDLQAARSTHVHFIARVKPGDTNRFLKQKGIDAVVEDLDGLSAYLKEQLC